MTNQTKAPPKGSAGADLLAAVRALLAVFEAGGLNTSQRHAVHQVRVLIGDAEGLGCAHESVAFEAGDALVCQDCREILNSDS